MKNRTCTAAALACVAGLLSACGSSSTRTSADDPNRYPEEHRPSNVATSPFGTGAMTPTPTPNWTPTNSRDNTVSTAPFGTGAESPSKATRSATAVTDSSPDARVLSILHAKNQEEIEIGRLAQTKGYADDVREYGAQLVRDHTENDANVMATARAAGITLMSPAEVNGMLMHERGDHGLATDPVAKLRAVDGREFDRVFAQTMQAGHAEMVRVLENAKPSLQNEGVRELVARTLPTLHRHEQVATRLEESPRD